MSAKPGDEKRSLLRPEKKNSVPYSHSDPLQGKREKRSVPFWAPSNACHFPSEGVEKKSVPYSVRLQLDASRDFGVTKSAPDFNPFARLSWRF
jgi:hypothetical protein